MVALPQATLSTFHWLAAARSAAYDSGDRPQAWSSAVGFEPHGRPQPEAVESPITTACTPGCAGPAAVVPVRGSTPTRSSSVLTLRSTRGVPDAVSAIPPRFTAMTTAIPAASGFHIFGRLRTAAKATSGI